jgi:hypothetical protein
MSENIDEQVEVEELEGPDSGDTSSAKVADTNADTDDDGEETVEALDELEAEEREMLTEDESEETIVVDEAAEMRAIRRAEISMDEESADSAHSDEFVCSSCFLVKKNSQMANKRRKICFDCAG